MTKVIFVQKLVFTCIHYSEIIINFDYKIIIIMLIIQSWLLVKIVLRQYTIQTFILCGMHDYIHGIIVFPPKKKCGSIFQRKSTTAVIFLPDVISYA